MFDLAILTYLLPDATLPAGMDPLSRMMSDVLSNSALFVLAALFIAPIAVIGGSLFRWQGLKLGVNLLLAGLSLQFIIAALFIGNPFMPVVVLLPLIATSGLLLVVAVATRNRI
jgi:uncharacterized membrane protein